MNTVTDPVAVAADLRPVLLKLARHLRRELQELDVTGGQAAVLAHVQQHPGIGAGGLAEREGVSRPRMSKVVQELVAAGLLVGERGSDRRRVGLELTPGGRTVLKSIRRRRNAWLASRLTNLEPDELEQLEAAIPLLAQLLKAPE